MLSRLPLRRLVSKFVEGYAPSKYHNSIYNFLIEVDVLKAKGIHQSSQLFSIEGVEISEQRKSILVQLKTPDTNINYEYPWSFLQDNCTCPECYHKSSRSRLRKLSDLKLDNSLVKATVNETKDSISVLWEDNHTGSYSENWLRNRNFSEHNISRRKTLLRGNPFKLIDSSHPLPTIDFEELMVDAAKLKKLLNHLCSEGVARITNAPKISGVVKRIAERIAFIRITHYGLDFTVKSSSNAVNLAYTSAALGVHTDLPYYVYPPGVQLLHCIKQFEGVGGDTHLVDGFFVAEKLRVERPDVYNALCNISVEFFDIGQDYTTFEKIHHSPTFVLEEKTQNLIRVVYSNQQLSSYQPIPLDKVNTLYEALKMFTDRSYASDSLREFKMSEGEVIIFDNWRYLHGRTGFDPSLGERHFQGCYVDWDEVVSTLRVLKKNVNES